MTLLQIHFFAVSAWVGLLAGESVMELHAHGPAAQHLIARIHKWIDIFFEGPLVVAVLATGSILLYRVWPAPSLLLVKVGAAMIGIVANVICIPWVQARAQTENEEALRTLTRKIAGTGLAIPFVLLALVIGLHGF